MEADVSKYTDELNRLNKAKEIEDSLGQPMNKPLLTQPGAADDKSEKRGRASDEYRKATMRALRTNFQEISNVLREGSDADGGYLVPEEWDSRLIEELENVSIMRNLATVIPTSLLQAHSPKLHGSRKARLSHSVMQSSVRSCWAHISL